MRKTMTVKQLEANRRNARKSTGPRTPAGREVSRLNALKHGILSKEVLVRGVHGRESRREFTALHRRFTDELQPEGPLEEMLVDQIVTTHWRLRRALVAEAGEIALKVDEGRWRRECGPNHRLMVAVWDASGDPVHAMQESALGNSVLEAALRKAKALVEARGELTEEAIGVLRLRGQSNPVTSDLEELLQQWRQQHSEAGDDQAAREKHKETVLTCLTRELNLVSWRKSRCEEHEAGAAEARQAAALLPSADVLDKILRYETKLERQMFRAMTQLERLQRMRRGEAVPAPLTVEVSERERAET